ncbi:hypothetical protein [Streptomyces sp. CBMA123]|uniref:hypothetical protein n=1 Tax=Streptomyces sp. CBMA123 TaxID=1896313 RepID=UPI001661E391|nr:hypothetical protein [Streptomyces sp. CBMA123]MBD0692193.1 hypothetical protein [Streptomyces sp. CBMA123]
MTADHLCANQRDGLVKLVAAFDSLTTTTDRTEKQLAALKAAHAAPATIASVQETLDAEREQLAQIALEGKVAAEDFQQQCGGEPLPRGAEAFLTT